jgi:hypothetical protein
LARAYVVAGALLTLLPVGTAAADDYHVDSDTAFQLYEVRSPGTAVFMARRRLLQTLALTWSRQMGEPDVGEEPAPRISGSLRLRLDQDFGQTCLIDRDLCFRATEPGSSGDYQPLASDTEVDAPEAWVEVRGLPASARLRLGRQLEWGPAGIFRLDGASAHASPLGWLGFSAYGGALVRQTSLAAVGTFEPQGIVRRNRDELEPGEARWIDDPTTTWAYGGALDLGHPDVLALRLGYRHFVETEGDVSQTAALSLSSRPVKQLGISARGVWDLLGETVRDAEAELSVTPIDVLSFRVRAEHHVPRFDYGSIWMYFDLVPITEGLVSATWKPTRSFELGAGARTRYASLGEDDEENDVGFEGHGLASLYGFDIGVWGFTWGGDLGPVAGALLDISRAFAWWVRLDLRASVWHFDDPLRQGLDGTSVADALGVLFILSEPTKLRFDFQHSYNEVVGHRFRFVAHLSVEVWR